MPNPQQPSAPLAHSWSMSYPMTLRSVRLARLHVRRRLTMWNWAGDVDDAVLVVSELVANAVLHGKLPGQELWLRVAELECGGLNVDVSDPSRALPVLKGNPGGEGGRGLLLVSRLADELDWFLRADVGKTVRARLAVPDRTNAASCDQEVPDQEVLHQGALDQEVLDPEGASAVGPLPADDTGLPRQSNWLGSSIKRNVTTRSISQIGGKAYELAHEGEGKREQATAAAGDRPGPRRAGATAAAQGRSDADHDRNAEDEHGPGLGT